MARVLIGTSGWHYESWRGPFFPRPERLIVRCFNVIQEITDSPEPISHSRACRLQHKREGSGDAVATCR